MGIRIVGTGCYVPDKVVTNEDFTAFLDTSNEWIVTRTGMEERHISMGQPTWKLGEMACRQAMEAAGVTAGEIDLILCTTVTGDYHFPSVACMIQGALGAENAFVMDIAAACAGTVYALDMARRYLLTGDVETILLVGAEELSQVTDYTDRSTCVLFGDGAGAAVIKRGNGLFGASLYSDPTGAKLLYSKKPREHPPFGEYTPLEEELRDFPKENGTYMNGREVYKFATRAMPRAIEAACKKAGVTVGDVDLIIPHQANLRIIESAVKYMGVSMEKVAVTIHKYGNTSSSSIMICLDEVIREGRLLPGQKFCMVGFGSGLTYGALVAEYHP